MEKEELKELLKNLPDEDYLDKLIEAVNLWLKVGNDLPDEDMLDKIIQAGLQDFSELPDEDELDKNHCEQFFHRRPHFLLRHFDNCRSVVVSVSIENFIQKVAYPFLPLLFYQKQFCCFCIISCFEF